VDPRLRTPGLEDEDLGSHGYEYEGGFEISGSHEYEV
jgi:hypothetical protein